MKTDTEHLKRAFIKSLTLIEVTGHPVFSRRYKEHDAFVEALLLANEIYDSSARKHALRQMAIYNGIKLKDLERVLSAKKIGAKECRFSR